MKHVLFIVFIAPAALVGSSCNDPSSTLADLTGPPSCVGADGLQHCGPSAKNKKPAPADAQPKTFGASSGGDRPATVPVSQTVPAWFFDPANASTCASDNNNCTQSTCGAAGSFQGPCVDWPEVVDRWGTTSPYTNQLTTLTWISSEANGHVNEVVITPQVGLSGFMWINTIPTVSAPGTITVVAPKLISANQPLQVTFSSGAPTQGVLVHNTTHASRAWVDLASTTINGNVGSLMTQPFALAVSPPGLPIVQTPQVDTWTTGDSFVFETPQKVNLRVLQPTFVDSAGGTLQEGSGLAVQQVWAPSPDGVNDGATVEKSNGQVIIQETRSDLTHVALVSGIGKTRFLSWDNDWFSAGGSFSEIFVFGGAVGTLFASTGNTSLGFDGNTIVHGVWSLQRSPAAGQIGAMYMGPDGDTRFIGHVAMSSGFGYGLGIYGSGILRAEFTGGITYPFGASQAAATFNGTTIFFGFNSSHGCLSNPTAVSTTLTCNIALSAANLDTNLGATVAGCVYVPGLSSYCNTP
jgi:hypothetical protein